MVIHAKVYNEASSETVNSLQSFFQGLSSSGPMLNIFGLFPVIVAIALGSSFIVIIISIILGFLSVYTGFTFSRHIRSNGGYYSYVAKFMGKDMGMFTASVYFFYSILAVPSVVLFLVYFTGYVFPGSSVTGLYGEIFLSVIFTSAIVAVFMSGFRHTMSLIMILSGLEIVVVIVFTVYVAMFFSSASVAYAPPSHVIGVLPFGILAFAGIGSSIFLSENSRSWRHTINRSILYSYLALAFLMALPAAAISYRLGTSAEIMYASDPMSLFGGFGISGQVLGTTMMIIAMTSAFNLALGYLNAFRHAVSRMVSDHVITDHGSIFSRNVWITILAITLPLVISLEATVGSYTGFVIVTGIVGLAFLFVHAIANSALVRFFSHKHNYWRAVIPVISTVTFVFIIAQETISGGIFGYSAYAVVFILIFSVMAVAVKKFFLVPSYRIVNISDTSAEFSDKSLDS